MEQKLRQLPSNAAHSMTGLLEHVMDTSGKKIRPAVTILASKFHPHTSTSPIIMATAAELLHIATLIHDDTVDNSAIRRGRATVSSRWGRNVAVLLGDYVFATSASFVCDTNNVRVIRRFSETIMELSSGELFEIFSAFDWTLTLDDYLNRIYKKTASLFCTAAESGAILSGAPEDAVQSLYQFGYNIGMAFQIVDDILDFQGTEEEVGKPVGNDLLQGTLTLPALLLMERYPHDNPIKSLFQDQDREANLRHTVEMVQNSSIIQDSYAVAHEYRDKAVAALHQLADNRARQSLLELASYVMERRK